jgi:hypothetical protein
MDMNQDHLSSFVQIVTNYWLSVSSYRDFLTEVEAHLSTVEQTESQRISELLEPLRSATTEEDRAQIVELVTRIAEVEKNHHDHRLLPVKQLKEIADDLGSLKLLESMNHLTHAMSQLTPAERHRELLYRSVLTGLVGQFEVLISDLAHAFFLRSPNALGTEEKVLSINELKNFESISDAFDFVIANRVDDLLRGSVSEWQKFFFTRMKIDMAVIAPDWQRFVEFFQRRHLIVHTGGLISRRYLANVSDPLLSEYFDNAAIGTQATLSASYSKMFTEHFEISGLLLAYHTWLKLYPSEQQLIDQFLMQHVYSLMQSGRWGTVRALASWATTLPDIETSSRIVHQVNYWLASKELGSWKEIQIEVERFDCSALQPVYALARAALLDDADEFFAILDATNGAQLEVQAWMEWPIFTSMRKDIRFEAYRQRYM